MGTVRFSSRVASSASRARVSIRHVPAARDRGVPAPRCAGSSSTTRKYAFHFSVTSWKQVGRESGGNLIVDIGTMLTRRSSAPSGRAAGASRRAPCSAAGAAGAQRSAFIVAGQDAFAMLAASMCHRTVVVHFAAALVFLDHLRLERRGRRSLRLPLAATEGLVDDRRWRRQFVVTSSVMSYWSRQRSRAGSTCGDSGCVER